MLSRRIEASRGQGCLADGDRLGYVTGRVDRRHAHQVAKETDRLVSIDCVEDASRISIGEWSGTLPRPCRHHGHLPASHNVMSPPRSELHPARGRQYTRGIGRADQVVNGSRNAPNQRHSLCQEGKKVLSSGMRVAMVLAPNFEDSEAVDPKEYVERLGAEVTVIGIESGKIAGKKGATLDASATFGQVTPGDFDLLIIPGGGSPENLRIHDPAVEFTRKFVESGKPVAAICHGAQLLISAKVLDGRTLTAVNKIRDDVTNAGGKYVDEPLVVDGNLITSRVPGDLPVFDEAIGKALKAAPAAVPV